MNGSFIPSFTMGVTDVEAIRRYTDEPVDCHLMVDGHCSPEVIEDLSSVDADGFVLGSSALFKKGKTYQELL